MCWVGVDLLSLAIEPSTIGAGGLNDSVRKGKRWCPAAKDANMSLRWTVNGWLTVWYRVVFCDKGLGRKEGILGKGNIATNLVWGKPNVRQRIDRQSTTARSFAVWSKPEQI